jgi:hypothetical protein
MCEFSKKLIAWLDDELDPQEAAALGAHLSACEDCRRTLTQNRKASAAFASYREAAVDAAFAVPDRPRRQRRIWAVVGSAAAMVLLLISFVKHQGKLPRETGIGESLFLGGTGAPRTASAVGGESAAGPNALLAINRSVRTKTRKRHHTPAVINRRTIKHSPGESVSETPVPIEPSFEIVIPADESFPPGALPQGIGYVASMIVRASSSLEEQPQLTGFERRTQP